MAANPSSAGRSTRPRGGAPSSVAGAGPWFRAGSGADPPADRSDGVFEGAEPGGERLADQGAQPAVAGVGNRRVALLGRGNLCSRGLGRHEVVGASPRSCRRCRADPVRHATGVPVPSASCAAYPRQRPSGARIDVGRNGSVTHCNQRLDPGKFTVRPGALADDSLRRQRRTLGPGYLRLPPAVGREGFEPSKAEPADLQSAPFGHSGTDPQAGRISPGPAALLFRHAHLRCRLRS